MHVLQSSDLSVSVLDPVADRDKLGSRYCVGGYIWQVDDRRLGTLTSGPCFPGKTNGFDGQGLPEVFEIALGQEQVQVGQEVDVIGVGKVLRSSPIKPFHVRDNRETSLFTAWETALSKTDAFFRTTQEHGAHALRLTRRIALQARTLISATTIENLAATRLPVRWFAHPFFPWDNEKVFRFSTEARLPDNAHWQLDPDNWVRRRAGSNWRDGSSFLPLILPFGYPVTIEQGHPLLGSVRIECDFPLAHLPIWGNEKTVSCEPYFHTVVEPAAMAGWSIAYHF
jgi:hypothetical protein